MDELKKNKLAGKDELNLIEVPFTLLTNEAAKDKKTIKFTDRQDKLVRQWTITSSDQYGLPCAQDEAIFIALLALTKENKFKNPKIYFNKSELLSLMGWATNKQHYDRLVLGIKRLHGVSIYTDLWWFGKGFATRNVATGFHILEEFHIADKGIKNRKNSWIQWGETLFSSFITGSLKTLDLNKYFNLPTPLSRRLYRLCDKRFHQNERITFDLLELAHEKLGMSRNIIRPSLIKQKLESAIDKNIENNLIESAEYKKGKNKKWILILNKYNPSIPDEDPIKKDLLFNKLTSLKISEKKAKEIINNYSKANIEHCIKALNHIKPIPENPPGFLIRALEEDYIFPDYVEKKIQAEIAQIMIQQDRKNKEEYNKFLIQQVDLYLKKCEKAIIDVELEEHKKKYLEAQDLDEKYITLDHWMPYIEYDYKKEKAKTLDLISFNEWKKEYKETGK